MHVKTLASMCIGSPNSILQFWLTERCHLRQKTPTIRKLLGFLEASDCQLGRGESRGNRWMIRMYNVHHMTH